MHVFTVSLFINRQIAYLFDAELIPLK